MLSRLIPLKNDKNKAGNPFKNDKKEADYPLKNDKIGFVSDYWTKEAKVAEQAWRRSEGRRRSDTPRTPPEM